jgi:hypothetical protein
LEHKGIAYDLLQTSPSGWKWVARISATKTRTGFSYSQKLAVLAAIKAIDKALKQAK